MPETSPLERAIVDILWPNGSDETEWDSDTFGHIAQAFYNHRPDLTPYTDDNPPVEPRGPEGSTHPGLFLLGDIKPCP